MEKAIKLSSSISGCEQKASLESILSEPENRAVIESLSRFAKTLNCYGLFPEIYSERSVLKLNTISRDDKRKIIDSFELSQQWYEPSAHSTDLHVSLATERKCVEKALNHFGLQVHDDFWKTFRDDQIIEFYGDNMIQLYRGLNFYKFCGYSLLDISVFEWFILWERPKIILDVMMRQIQKVIAEKIDTEPFEIPKHILRENFTSGLTEGFIPRAYLAEFVSIGVLRRHAEGLGAGFICTARGSVIAEGDEALSIGFV